MRGKEKTPADTVDRYAGITYEQVVRRFADTVTRVCVMRCQNVEDAKDCFQNVFLKLYTADTVFDTEEHLKAWLITVAIHQCADLHRQAWRQRVSLEEDIAKLEMLGVTTDERTEDSRVFMAVMRLPVKYREVIYLYYYEEYSVSEIARILNRKENTVKSDLRRARERLKEVLTGEGNVHEMDIGI